MNVLDLLKEDHRKVEKIFEEIDNTTDKAIKTREILFSKVKQELLIHTELEETLFYPEFENNSKVADLTKEAYEEHNLVKTLLEEISNFAVDAERWLAKVTVLKENVEHHIQEEEKDLFPQVKKILGAEKLKEIGKKMTVRKKELMM